MTIVKTMAEYENLVGQWAYYSRHRPTLFPIAVYLSGHEPPEWWTLAELEAISAELRASVEEPATGPPAEGQWPPGGVHLNGHGHAI